LPVFLRRDGLVKMCEQEPVQPSVISGKLLAKAALLLLRGVRFGRLDTVEFREEPRCPIEVVPLAVGIRLAGG